MSKKSTPTFYLVRDGDECRLQLTGYRGGLRQTYGRATLPKDVSHSELTEAIQAIIDLTGIHENRARLVKAE